MLLHIPNVLTVENLREVRSALANAPWVDGRQTVGDQGAQVKRNRQLPVDSPEAQRLGAIVLEAVQRNATFFAAALPARIVPPLFNRYAGGEAYGLHVDGAMRRQPNGQWLRTDLSCTLFLCEPDEYDGGELEVVDTFGTHSVKLPAGDLLVYSANSLHQVLPVTRGERVCSFFWLQSMVRDDVQRGQLYELDRAIQSLRQRVGECPETLALNNVYHNLLRVWADA